MNFVCLLYYLLVIRKARQLQNLVVTTTPKEDYEVNLWVGRSLRGSGEVDVELTVDGKNVNTVRINIK
ncbi:MAG TPA: hypothetical protein VLE22_12955 [Bryobacteraceae bacterium]|nr:hypothetical protein [Bryobacteraceae bacterium]